MLKPVSGGANCEADGDSLLVSILQKATSDCRAGRAHRAAATATAMVTSLLGEGVDLNEGNDEVTDEDDDVEGEEEEVSEDSDDAEEEDDDVEAVENSCLAQSEQQVVDRVGGYIVSRLGRQGKLRCTECRAALIQSGQQGILVQERQHDGAMLLSSSGASLTAFLQHCERRFRLATKPCTWNALVDGYDTPLPVPYLHH